MEDLLFNLMMAGHANKKFINPQPCPVSSEGEHNAARRGHHPRVHSSVSSRENQHELQEDNTISGSLLSPPESLVLYLFWVLETGS